MIEKRDFYINGAWVAPAVSNDFQVINPSTEEPCAVISLGSEADTNAAVAAAKAALPGWMATPVAERIALVEKLIEIYQSVARIWRRRCRWKWALPSTCRAASRWARARGT